METREADTREKLPVIVETPSDPTGGPAPEFALTVDQPTTWVAGEWAGTWSATTREVAALTPLVGTGQPLPAAGGQDLDLYVRWTVGAERPIRLVDRYRFT